MKMAYNGSHAVVDVPALGQSVTRGEPVEIEDHRLARQLKRQGWRRVKENDDENGKGDS